MMRIFSIFLLVGFIALFGGVSPASAQGHGAFCAKANSTAETQRCLKRHLDAAQKRLKETYGDLTKKLEGESLSQLKELQATWLRYRDAECMWEAARSSTTALKRVNEISCMARVTDDRADLLEIALNDSGDAGIQREYGSFPRWMNALSQDYSEVYWNYGARMNADLNCDGVDEYIMQGVVNIAHKNEGEEAEDKKLFEQQSVLAVVQNPPVGRPSADIFRFKVSPTSDDASICNDTLSLAPEIIEQEATDEGVEEAPAVICQSRLVLKDKGCDTKYIQWAGKNFELQLKEEPEQTEAVKAE